MCWPLFDYSVSPSSASGLVSVDGRARVGQARHAGTAPLQSGASRRYRVRIGGRHARARTGIRRRDGSKADTGTQSRTGLRNETRSTRLRWYTDRRSLQCTRRKHQEAATDEGILTHGIANGSSSASVGTPTSFRDVRHRARHAVSRGLVRALTRHQVSREETQTIEARSVGAGCHNRWRRVRSVHSENRGSAGNQSEQTHAASGGPGRRRRRACDETVNWDQRRRRSSRRNCRHEGDA